MSQLSQNNFPPSPTAMGPEIGVVLQRADGTIAACNRATQDILGMTIEQLQDAAATNLADRTIHRDGTPFLRETYPANVTLQTGEPYFIEMGFYKSVHGLYQYNTSRDVVISWFIQEVFIKKGRITKPVRVLYECI
jgi:PAS domain-containing protein